MKIQRMLFAPVLLCVVSAAMWAGVPASAQTAATTGSTATSVLVSVKGIVTGSPESVSFSGKIPVSVNVVIDSDFGNTPTAVLTIDLSALGGVGQSTGKTYVTAGQEIIQRKLVAADTVQVTFPFYLSGANPATARVGVASFALSFNVKTMTLTGATAQLASAM